MFVKITHIMSVIGFPSLFSIFCLGFNMIRKRITSNDEETKAIKLGVQAMLRSDMINNYRYWSGKGFAPIYAKDNFENCWQQYHNLGVNGVMDDIHQRFMELPIEPKKADRELTENENAIELE